jgi:lipopolysaccharide transport system ATP-binding protein
MYLRLAFSVAAHLEPEILLVDEILAVGDAAFQKKCLGTMEHVAQQGRTVLFVSHNMGAVRALCNKGILLGDGGISHCENINTTIESYYRSIGALQSSDNKGSGSTGKSTFRFGMTSINDGQGSTIQQSQTSQLSTTLSMTQAVSGFTLYCILEDMQGRQLFHLREESPTFGLKDVAARDYAITLKLPALWLNPGLYSVYFKVSDKFPLDVSGVSSAIDSTLHPQATWLVQ